MRIFLIQITRWLSQVAVWRFVGFVSTFVGLLCYGLSSSFNYLFGEWNLLKILLYTVFSLFICLWSLFAKVCQHSTSLRFKAHSAFLVLTITSVYSYFADKVVNGKPDANSLISCAAFVIMSFSLSRQTQCGFEVDLSYFFMGCFIVLLMKINLALAIVGVGFSYSLITLRSYLDATSYENPGIQDEHLVVIDVNSLSTDNASNNMMQQLVDHMKALGHGNLNLPNMLWMGTRKYLNQNRSDELVGFDQNFVIDGLPSEKINELEKTIKLMVGDGLEKECGDVYCNWRRESLEECLKYMLNFEGINIRGWVQAVNVTRRILFPRERQLCDIVFLGCSSVADLCYTKVCQGAMVKLLNFADDYASRDPWPLPLESTHYMVEALGDLIPEVHALFPRSSVNEVLMVRDKLGEECRGIFMKMEDEIFSDPHRNVIVQPNVICHPMTRCVMDYLDQNLENFRKFSNVTGTSSVSEQVDRVMKRLEGELVAMSENYKYPALCHLFMMNNWRYLERRPKPRRYLEFFQNCPAIVRRNQELYERSAWKMVIDFLKLENDELVDAQPIKDNLINEHMEFLCRHQSTWPASRDLLTKQIFLPTTDDLDYDFNRIPNGPFFSAWRSEEKLGQLQ
ncbi:hypothetical protein Fmac_031291 [Flemingia macrophylla]|uniref:Exocyst subunit Exo70 family protein n=1 Tax=Flemingia macrophylla TaxID=520843 RepID=A0ABD1L1K9_9FABA